MREPGMFPGEGDALVCMNCGQVAYSAASMAASRQAVADHDAVVEHRIEAFRLTRNIRAEAAS